MFKYLSSTWFTRKSEIHTKNDLNNNEMTLRFLMRFFFGWFHVNIAHQTLLLSMLRFGFFFRFFLRLCIIMHRAHKTHFVRDLNDHKNVEPCNFNKSISYSSSCLRIRINLHSGSSPSISTTTTKKLMKIAEKMLVRWTSILRQIHMLSI